MDTTGIRLYTIGHSNHLLDKFMHLLQANSIQALVDVRSSPYSKFNPQFNQDPFSKALSAVQIAYIYAGRQLGGRPADPTCYKSHEIHDAAVDYLHEVNYPEVMKRDWFRSGISRLLEIAVDKPACIMCSEEDPAHCHRHHLISKYILQNFPEVEIWHIRGDGNLVKASQIHASVEDDEGEQMSLF